MANEKRLIYAEPYEEFLMQYAQDLIEMDAPMIAGAIGRCISKLNGQPTVDAVEVVHGRWLKGEFDGEYICSRCGMEYCEADPTVKPYKYCPACGSENE